jgi:hypothetical protein
LVTDHHQIPRYLHDKISAIPASAGKKRRLDRFHNALSKVHDEEILLEKCVWIGTASGQPCTYSAENSIAQNMDTFQEALKATAGCDLTLCVININAGNSFEPFVPWTVLDTTPPATNARQLIELILQDRWPETCTAMEEDVAQLKARLPPQLAWNMELPSGRGPPNGMPHGKPSLFGFDVTLEWPCECPEVDTLFGSQDWSIYVSEPYNQRPSLQVLRMKDDIVHGSGSHRLMMFASSGSTTKHLKRRYDDAIISGAIDVTSPAEFQMLGSLLVAVRTVIIETGRYIEGSVKLIQQLVSQLAR